MDFLLSIIEIYRLNFKWGYRGKEHWFRKIAIYKRGRTAIPLWNIFVSVSTHINKTIVKNVGKSTGTVNNNNFTNVYDWSNSRPDFLNIIPVTQKLILEVIRLANFVIFNNTVPEFLVKRYQIWIWLLTFHDQGI